MSGINVESLATMSPEELVKLAGENGKTLSVDEAKTLLEKLSASELADDELDSVAGGGWFDGVFGKCSKCGANLKVKKFSFDDPYCPNCDR